MLIDTGSTKTLINTRLYNHFRMFAVKIPFKVKTAHGLTEHSDAVQVDIPDIFKVEMKHTFYRFDFSPHYDGLIGIDLLEKLEAVLDIRRRKLITKHAEIPIFMNAQNKFVMEPLQATPIRVPVDKKKWLRPLPKMRNFPRGSRKRVCR